MGADLAFDLLALGSTPGGQSSINKLNGMWAFITLSTVVGGGRSLSFLTLLAACPRTKESKTIVFESHIFELILKSLPDLDHDLSLFESQQLTQNRQLLSIYFVDEDCTFTRRMAGRRPQATYFYNK